MGNEVQRNYKDTIFRMIFKEAPNALSLYNSLNGTAHTDTSLLEFNTLENAIFMNMKNDLSFIIMDGMHLYEQQATYTPNMPLRDLLYVADIFQKYIKDKSVYSSKLIRLPNPHFVVFYNGTEPCPECSERCLSDAYICKEDRPELELRVTILNINPGMNESLKKKCPVLKDYVTYVETVRAYAKNMELKDAVEQAIDECIRNDVLRQFLSEQKAEVVKVSIYEYDEERELKLIRADEREIGREIGREEERAKREEAERECEEERAKREEAYKSIAVLYKEMGLMQEDAIKHLVEKCFLEQAEAEEIVKKSWESPC